MIKYNSNIVRGNHKGSGVGISSLIRRSQQLTIKSMTKCLHLLD